jgi:hypothetical protein
VRRPLLDCGDDANTGREPSHSTLERRSIDHDT